MNTLLDTYEKAKQGNEKETKLLKQAFQEIAVIAEDYISQQLADATEVVVDPSAIPYLPEIVPESIVTFRVPRILYQLLAVEREGIPRARVLERDMPGGQIEDALWIAAQTTLSAWISRRKKINWETIKQVLSSEKCQPIWAQTDFGLSVQSAARVVAKEEAVIAVEGIEDPNLIGLTVGQELGGAAEKKLPVVAANEKQITQLASQFLSTWVVGGTNKLVDRKQQFMAEKFGKLPKKSRGLRWSLGIVLGGVSLVPLIGIPAGLVGLGLMMIDP